MIPETFILSLLCFILMEVNSSNAVTGGLQKLNGTETDHKLNLRRSKRTPFDNLPDKLKIRIKYGTEEVDLKWVKIEPYLANKHLPVITPFAHLNPNVMENVGDFVMYHDVQKCSAVVYFEKFQTLVGVIGLHYYIVSLPFDFNEQGHYNLGVVGEPYVQRHENLPIHIHPHNIVPPLSDNDAWEDFFRQFESNSNHNLKRRAEREANRDAKRHRHAQHSDEVINGMDVDMELQHNMRNRRTIPVYQTFYLEILIFVTHDIAQLFEQYFGAEHYIEWIVKYYIVYFNAVDMVLRKLRNPYGVILTNIAKIVVEDDLTPFDFINRDGQLQFSEIVAKVPEYLEAYPDGYLPDSFDYVFIHTSRTIMDEFFPVRGLTKHGDDLYEARKMHRFYDVVPITVATYQYNFGNYEVAVHEIGRIFNLKIDPQDKGLNSMGQCYGVMQIDGAKCDNCLKWSDESMKQFKDYLRSNRNRCFLLNAPHSLASSPIRKVLSAFQQCRCFGYLDHVPYKSGCPRLDVGIRGCNKPLRCETAHPRFSHIDTVRPFDGTLCSHKKVCWNGKCVQPSMMKESDVSSEVSYNVDDDIPLIWYRL